MFDKLKSIANKTLGEDCFSIDAQEPNHLAVKLKDAGTDIAKKAKDFNLFEKYKNFATSAVKTVEELDDHLIKTRSHYEINDFRVSSTAGITAGLTLDIHFVKSAGAREIAAEQTKFLTIVHPQTELSFKVPYSALVGKEKAKVKDPKTGDILEVLVKTGEVLDILPAKSENE